MVLLGLAACRSGSRDAPLPTSIEPARALEGAPAAVTISGQGFSERVFTDFGQSSNSHADASWAARLGTTPLRQVRLTAEGTLTAEVPEGLAPGVYDLTVVSPWQGEGVLEKAFRVVAVGELEELVVGYRIEPIAPQRMLTPFAVTVTAVDAQGAQVPFFNGVVSLSDLTGTAVPRQVGFFVSGRWTGSVEVRKPNPAEVLTVLDDKGRTGSSNAFAVASREPAALLFTSAGQSLLSGDCSKAATLTVLDSGGFEAAVGSPLPVALDAEPAAGFELFSDSGCTQALATPEVPAGESRLAFYFRGMRAGSVRVSARATGLQSDSQLEVIRSAAPIQVAVVSGAQTVTAGSCSARVALESQDAAGNAAAVVSDVPIALAGAPADRLGIYADSNCSQPVAAAAIPAGTASASFYFRAEVAGPLVLTATPVGLGAGGQTETIVPEAGSALVFTTSPQRILVETCSAAVGLEVRDRFGNVAPGGARAIALGIAPSSGLGLFADSGCSAPISQLDLGAGAAAASFFFKGTADGSYQVQATAAGLSDASQTENISPPLPDHLAFTTAAQQLVAGSCSGPLTVQAQDAKGVARAPQSDVVVSLSAPAGRAFYSDAACSRPITSATIAGGTDSVSVRFSSSVAGAAELAADFAGWVGARQTETIAPAPAEKLSFVSGAQKVTAGDCSAVVQVGLEDRFGNLSAATSGELVGLSAAPSNGFKLFADPACASEITSVSIPVGSALADFYFKGTRAAQVAVAATAGGLATAFQIEEVLAKVPTRIAFTTPPRTVTAGACSAILVAQSQDALGNPVAVSSPTPVALTSTGTATFAFYADGSCAVPLTAPTFQPGLDVVGFYVRDTTAGQKTITATAFGSSDQQVATVEVGPAAKLSFDPIASPQPQNVAFDVAVRASDLWGNPTPSFNGTAALTLVGGGAVSCTANCSAAATTAAFSAGVWRGSISVGALGAQLLVATAPGLIGTSPVFQVVAPPPRSPPRPRLTAFPAALVAGGSTLLDAGGSLDYQSPRSALTASWDSAGSATTLAPWTPYASSLQASASYPTAGIYRPRVGISDPDGDSAMAWAPVVVVASAGDLCTVNTASLVDDGATDCAGASGPDGKLSLPEAVRLANSSAAPKTITFAGPMTVAGSALLTVSAPMQLAGGPGVALGIGLSVGAALNLYSVELIGGASVVVQPSGSLSAEDVEWRDAAPLVVQGSARLVDVRMSGCGAACIRDVSSGALTLERSTLRGRGAYGSGESAVGIAVESCSASATPLALRSTAFWRLTEAVHFACPRPVEARFTTFHEVGTGIDTSSAASVIDSSIFSTGTMPYAVPAAAQVRAALLFANAGAPAFSGALELNGDPLFVYPAAGDLRLLAGSPGVDSGVDSGLDVNGPLPGLFFGLGPDRGAVESR